MMERRNATNVREFSCLGGYQHITASASPDRFVVLRDVQADEMRGLIGEFAAAHEKAVREVLLAPRSGVEAQAVRSRVTNGNEEFRGRLQSPYMLQAALLPRRDQKNVVQFGIAQKAAVRAVANKLGIGDKYVAIEGRLYSEPWCNFLTEPYDAQALIAEELLGPELRNLDWMNPGHDLCNASSRIVIDAFAEADGVDGFLSRIAEETWELVGVDDVTEQTKKKRKRRAADGNRPLAIAWFAAWLANRGFWLFPLNSWYRIVEMVPIAFESLWNGLLLPEERAKFSTRLEREVLTLSRAGDNMRTQYRRFLRWLPLVSSFHDFRQASDDFLVHLREFTAGTKLQIAASRFAIRAVWDVTKNNVKGQVSAKELVAAEQRVYREGRLKKKGQRPWQWIDDEDYAPHPHEKYIPAKYRPAPRIIGHVEELRRLLLGSGRKTLEGILTALTIWLGYLATIPDEERPLSILEIDRNRHVNSLGMTEKSTLVDFFETACVPTNSIKTCLSNLRKMWLLSQTAARRYDLTCPIDLSLDSKRISNRTGRPGRTHRRALDEEILEFIIAENRRDDFAFSRGFGRHEHERRVHDPEMGRRTLEWWPGPAVLVDLMLHIPLRKFQARFLDSGEGDELSLNINTLEFTPNPLSTATMGRQECFFTRQSLKIIEDTPVLGMHINTNKSGDHYYIPWVPDDVATNVARVIDWQKRYNPMTGPIRAANPHYLQSYVADDLHIDVYPIFRDPERADRQPIGENGLHTYFMALLTHCQRKFNDLTGRNISFFYDDGSPIFDIHSLRVTGVTVLLEKGVDPKIVQMLVGHAAQEMTWWYDAIEDRRVNSALLKALETRKPTVEQILAMDETAYANFERFLFNTSLEQPATGTEMLRREVLSRTPGWDLMVHGICPGADCGSGGSKRDGYQQGVWRERACSLCRYRVTGPAFLGGLVLNLNKLMWELRQMQREVAALQDKLDAAEDTGKKVGVLHGEITRRKVELDHLWEEWFAEFTYIKRSEEMLGEWLTHDSAAGPPTSFPALLSPLGAEGIRLRTKPTADLPFLTNLLDGAEVIEGFVPPRGVREDRNAILLEIARRNDMSDLFYRVDRKKAEAAMDILAHTILDEVTDEDLDRFVSGDAPLAQFAFLRERFADATRSLSSPSSASLPPPAHGGYKPAEEI